MIVECQCVLDTALGDKDYSHLLYAITDFTFNVFVTTIIYYLISYLSLTKYEIDYSIWTWDSFKPDDNLRSLISQ
jgi:hypothetical protein